MEEYFTYYAVFAFRLMFRSTEYAENRSAGLAGGTDALQAFGPVAQWPSPQANKSQRNPTQITEDIENTPCYYGRIAVRLSGRRSH
jgi:hypothetical protein